MNLAITVLTFLVLGVLAIEEEHFMEPSSNENKARDKYAITDRELEPRMSSLMTLLPGLLSSSGGSTSTLLNLLKILFYGEPTGIYDAFTNTAVVDNSAIWLLILRNILSSTTTTTSTNPLSLLLYLLQSINSTGGGSGSGGSGGSGSGGSGGTGGGGSGTAECSDVEGSSTLTCFVNDLLGSVSDLLDELGLGTTLDDLLRNLLGNLIPRLKDDSECMKLEGTSRLTCFVNDLVGGVSDILDELGLGETLNSLLRNLLGDLLPRLKEDE